MDLIGVGFGRTGTASLKEALQHLGYPCYHMYDVFGDPARVAHWERVVNDGYRGWDEIFAGYRASVDWPGTTYWRELVDAYPEAPVVLTVRDAGRWYDSVLETIYPLSKAGGALDAGPGALPEHITRMRSVIQAMIWDGTFGGRFEDRAAAIAAYEQHHADVVAAVAPERLLVMEVAEGWAPLCKHLGVEIPAEAFPHLNDAASIRERFSAMLAGAGLSTPFQD